MLEITARRAAVGTGCPPHPERRFGASSAIARICSRRPVVERIASDENAFRQVRALDGHDCLARARRPRARDRTLGRSAPSDRRSTARRASFARAGRSRSRPVLSLHGCDGNTVVDCACRQGDEPSGGSRAGDARTGRGTARPDDLLEPHSHPSTASTPTFAGARRRGATGPPTTGRRISSSSIRTTACS